MLRNLTQTYKRTYREGFVAADNMFLPTCPYPYSQLVRRIGWCLGMDRGIAYKWKSIERWIERRPS